MASRSLSVLLLLLSLALCQSAVHGLADVSGPRPVERIQAAFKEVTGLSADLTVLVQRTTILNAVTLGPQIAIRFNVIIVKVTEYTARLAGTAYGYTPSPLDDDDAKLVVESLTTFVKVHQALLNLVIGKHGIFALFPFLDPLRLALVNLEIAVDTFAFYLIKLIPTQKPAANAQFSALSVTLKGATDTYGNSLQLPASLPLLQQTDKTDKKLADVIVDAINEIKNMSNALRVETEKINIVTAPRLGFIIAQGFTDIIAKIGEAIAALAPGSNPDPLDDDDAKLVVEALTTFVKVHEALLNVVIGKNGLLTLIPFFEPIRLALVQLELIVDTFAFTLINRIPTQAPAATKQVAALDVTIRLAVSTYSTPFFQTALADH